MKGVNKFERYASCIDEETGMWLFQDKALLHLCPKDDIFIHGGQPGPAFDSVERDTDTDKVKCHSCSATPPKEFHMWCWANGLKVEDKKKPEEKAQGFKFPVTETKTYGSLGEMLKKNYDSKDWDERIKKVESWKK